MSSASGRFASLSPTGDSAPRPPPDSNCGPTLLYVALPFKQFVHPWYFGEAGFCDS